MTTDATDVIAALSGEVLVGTRVRLRRKLGTYEAGFVGRVTDIRDSNYPYVITPDAVHRVSPIALHRSEFEVIADDG